MSNQYVFEKDTLKYLFSNIKDIFSTITEVESKVEKEKGKGLSSNDFTDESITNINNSFDDANTTTENGKTILLFYGTSVEGVKESIKQIDLDI